MILHKIHLVPVSKVSILLLTYTAILAEAFDTKNIQFHPYIIANPQVIVSNLYPYIPTKTNRQNISHKILV